MGLGADPTEEEAKKAGNDAPPVLPRYVRAVFEVTAGIVAASALFTALGSYVGWQYLNAYYGEIGIPGSALNFSTTDYLFAARPSVAFTLFPVLGVVAGVVLALLAKAPGPPQEGQEILGSFGLPEELSKLMGSLVSVIAFIIVMALIGAFGWLVVLFTLVTSVGVLVTSYFLTRSLRFRWAGKRRPTYFISVLLLSLVGASLLIVFAPGFLGRETASQHLDDSDGHFKRASLLISGRLGLVNEIPASLGIGGRSPASGCQEFVDKETTPQQALCEIPSMHVVLRNNGFYFLLKNETNGSRLIYSVPESRVVRIVYETGSSKGEPSRDFATEPSGEIGISRAPTDKTETRTLQVWLRNEGLKDTILCFALGGFGEQKPEGVEGTFGKLKLTTPAGLDTSDPNCPVADKVPSIADPSPLTLWLIWNPSDTSSLGTYFGQIIARDGADQEHFVRDIRIVIQPTATPAPTSTPAATGTPPPQ